MVSGVKPGKAWLKIEKTLALKGFMKLCPFG
jgi:hypothetical protein